MSVLEALVSIQQKLKSPKDQKADRYRYRNIEDINAAVKPLAAEFGCAVVYTDTFDDGKCVSKCTLMAQDGEISACGVAIVNQNPRGMSIEQSCGAASSYARKYAACGLFAIDSSENDPDRVNAQAPKNAPSEGDSRALDAAQARLKKASRRFAELEGMQLKDWFKQNILTRKDYANDAETLNRIAQELEES